MPSLKMGHTLVPYCTVYTYFLYKQTSKLPPRNETPPKYVCRKVLFKSLPHFDVPPSLPLSSTNQQQTVLGLWNPLLLPNLLLLPPTYLVSSFLLLHPPHFLPLPPSLKQLECFFTSSFSSPTTDHCCVGNSRYGRIGSEGHRHTSWHWLRQQLFTMEFRDLRNFGAKWNDR